MTRARRRPVPLQQRRGLLLCASASSDCLPHAAARRCDTPSPQRPLCSGGASDMCQPQAGESASGHRQCSRSAWVCSCPSCIVVLTPTLLCCAALLRPQSALRLHSAPALLHPRTEGVQQTTQLTTQDGRALFTVLPMHAQQTHHLLSSALQPKSASAH